MSTDPPVVKKFLFDRSFDGAKVVHRAVERLPVLLKPEQIDALKQESYDQGFAAGQKAGHDAQTAEQNGVLAALTAALETLGGQMDALRTERDRDTRALAVTMVRKLMPVLMEREGVEEIEALLAATLRDMAREPRLVVRTTPSQFDAVEERIKTLTAQLGYGGQVILLADKEVAKGDCRIEWADGGVVRDTQTTVQSIEQTLLVEEP